MSMFQRRHYVALARTMGENEYSEEIIDAFCVMLKYDNSNFNEARFRAAIEFQRQTIEDNKR